MSEQLYPFEKNRYYCGKMLTSADFRAEQRYVDYKRMFLNQMVLGKGVLCGLGVKMLNETSLLIESGAALDSAGREIIVPGNTVKKLKALEGYEGVDSGWAGLYIKYMEEETQPVCVVSRGEEYENNRIQESYQLFVSTIGGREERLEAEENFFTETMILDSEDYTISLRLPACVCTKTWVRLSVMTEKKSDKAVELSFSMMLKLPAFLSADGEQKLVVSREDIHLKNGEKEMYDCWLYTRDVQFDRTCLVWDKERSFALIDDEPMPFGPEEEITVSLTEQTPEELVQWKTGQITLEERNRDREGEAVKLADILLVKEDNEYVISDTRETGINKYIVTPMTERQRREYLSYYTEGEEPEYRAAFDKQETEEQSRDREELRSFIRGGVLEIPLDLKMKKGKIFYSEEIVHGLGPGNVYVDAGICESEDKAGRKKYTESVIYGDNSLFADKNTDKTCVQTAVKVFCSRGSFQVAVKLTGEQNSIVLPVSWTAIRIPEGVPEETGNRQMLIVPETPIKKMAQGERHYFGVIFKNMEPCHLEYEMTEKDEGDIGQDGIYTAPAKDGIFEIRITCEEYRQVCTYAYAVVGGKNEP